jgi:hypothetical protein
MKLDIIQNLNITVEFLKSHGGSSAGVINLDQRDSSARGPLYTILVLSVLEGPSGGRRNHSRQSNFALHRLGLSSDLKLVRGADDFQRKDCNLEPRQ